MGNMSNTKKYWLFQLGGWGIFAMVQLFFAITFDRLNGVFAMRLGFFILLGVILTHLMRLAVKRSDLLLKPINVQIIGLTAFTILLSIIISSLEIIIFNFFSLTSETQQRSSFSKTMLENSFIAFIFFFIWSCIYFIYHFIEKSRRQQLDTLRLEALVKELELKTIKAHINPHFIFNSLNSIRALIDENPGRARNAVTELSNILRSSMQTEKMELVSFEKELNIVKDYLALENMRFEDRLKVEYDIDEDTLSQLVPPMMLQTLVENAIKHGISKRVDGGVIKVISDFKNNYHELAVQNTGKLNGYTENQEGFGLSSTVNRINLLYGDKASFRIEQVAPSLVEARLLIPVIN